MTSNQKNISNNQTKDEDGELHTRPNKTQIKRDCDHLVGLGEDILKLKTDERESLNLPDELTEAVNTALKIKSRSGLKRQRLYIGKLIRSLDHEVIEAQVKKIQHRHDTNTAQFKRLEKWRDDLIDNNKAALNEVIQRYPSIDRQHINQLIRAAHQEKKNDKAPTASRKLFKYLHELEEKTL